MQIRFLLLQNRQGKTRLAKYYVPLDDDEKRQLEFEVHRTVVNRDAKFTNFVEFRNYKIIYRRYAGLFFSMVRRGMRRATRERTRRRSTRRSWDTRTSRVLSSPEPPTSDDPSTKSARVTRASTFVSCHRTHPRTLHVVR